MSLNRRSFLKNTAKGSLSVSTAVAAAGLFPRRIPAREFNRVFYRKLGSTGFHASEIGFGCMNMRDAELLEAAIDKGINYIDTANYYMRGANEEVVGSVMKRRRNDVFLTTKVGLNKNSSDTRQEIETSLKRLQTDHVDLLLFHKLDNRNQVTDEDFMEIFDEARKKGQTRFIGVATHSNQAEVIDEAVKTNFWEAVLTGYSYFSPPELTASIQNAREEGLAIIAMKSLINTERPRNPFPDIREDKTGSITNQQVLLKWVLDNPYIDVSIPGMTSFEHLDDDLAVMGMKLSFDDRHILRKHGENSRGRYCCGVAGCTGCRDKCPNGVAINEINRCLNYAYGYNDIELAHENYQKLPASSKIEMCSDCEGCVVECINGIDTTENIRRARVLFG